MTIAKQRLGIAVGAGEVRAALVDRSGKPSWTGTVRLGEHDDLESALVALLRTLPERAVLGARAAAVIGPERAQVKVLLGLPPVSDLATLGSIVRSVPQQFFLRGASSPVVTEPHRDAGGRVWCAAHERDVLVALERACREVGLALHVVLPTLTAIARRSPDGVAVWRDGHVASRLEVTSRWHAQLRRLAPGEAGDGERVEPGFDAVAAASATHRDPLSWRPAEDARQRRLRAWRTGVLAACVVLSGLASLLAPTVRVLRASERATPRIGAQSARGAELAATQRALRDVSGELDQIEQFLAARRSTVALLGAISLALPDSTAMLAFRVDSTGGAITALAPRMTDVVPALVETDQLVAPRLAGSVTRDVMSGALLERATIRFRFPAQAAAQSAASRGIQR